MKGESYETRSNKTIAAKVMKPPCECKKKCADKIPEETRARIFAYYYGLSFEDQNQYIAANIIEFRKATERERNDVTPSRRAYTRSYHLTWENTKLPVCQTMFVNTLDISVKKTRIIAEKVWVSGAGISPPDGRGNHDNHIAMSEDDKQFIRSHIRSFPAYESHYSRSHSSRRYLNQDLSVKQMYRLYEEKCNLQNLKPCSESTYRNIFNEDFNLSFAQPKNDTCSKCDQLQKAIQHAKDDEERAKLEDDKKAHVEIADSMYKEKDRDKARAKENESVVTLSFDLQKCLPTPFLTSGI